MKTQISSTPALAGALLSSSGIILEDLRENHGFKRLGINAHRSGKFLAEGWWGRDKCGSAWGETPVDAFENLLAQRQGRAGA